MYSIVFMYHDCNQCGHIACWNSNLNIHNGSKHEGVQHDCKACSQWWHRAAFNTNLTVHKQYMLEEDKHDFLQTIWSIYTHSLLKVQCECSQKTIHEGLPTWL